MYLRGFKRHSSSACAVGDGLFNLTISDIKPTLLAFQDLLQASVETYLSPTGLT